MEKNSFLKTEQEAHNLMMNLLKTMVVEKGSDLFITVGFQPAIKRSGKLTPVGKDILDTESCKLLASSIMNEKQKKEFEETKECNFAISEHGVGRFRVNAFIQRNSVGLVLRMINTTIPNFDDLKLPNVLKQVSMEKRGLVLLIGGTGSGKSTTLAAMIDYRNRESAGHIITIEDPIEYVHHHKKCIVNQREVGVDTDTWFSALKNTLRQAPDVILIGEIRDRETMEYALNFAETGHLCMSTIHANSANQAIERIVNFFPHEQHDKLFMELSLNLKGFISQRLIPNKKGGRSAAIEILLNNALVKDKIQNKKVDELKEIMKKSTDLGMKTFDDALFELIKSGEITLEEGLRNADNLVDLKLKISLSNQNSISSLQSNLDSIKLVDEE